MPSIIDHFSNLIRRLQPKQPRTSSDEMAPARPRFTRNHLKPLWLEHDRRSVVQDSRRMYGGDTRPREIISTLARDVVKGGFQVQVTGGIGTKRSQNLADALAQRLHLFARLDDWCRLTFRDGDSFLELSVDRAGPGGIAATVDGRTVLFAGDVSGDQVRALGGLMDRWGEPAVFDLRSPDRVVVTVDADVGDGKGSL